MEKKINIAELLKDCPSGMELDCTIWDNIIFEEIDGNNIVIFRKSTDAKVYLTQYGEFNSIDGKCVVFPKGKTTWEGFVPPCKFEDGDIVTWKENGSLVAFIYKERKNSSMVRHHFALYVGRLGPTSNMIHLTLAEKLKSITDMPQYERVPEAWLERNGWLKIHHDSIYGVFSNKYEDETYCR